MRTLTAVAILGMLCAWTPTVQCKEKYQVVTELEFQAMKMKLVGEKIALLTYMGDLAGVAGREIPSVTGKGSTFAVQASAFRKLVTFTIADNKQNEETLQVFYSLTPGTTSRPGSLITIYGKVIKTGPNDVSILVQRDGDVAIEAGWPEHMAPCPTCGRPGYNKAKKPNMKRPKRRK
ncbi:MAG: hypothetical protein GXP25_06565 [Planctomycetes bacterium]|nr:hypothetical protein [Planctomycetota bacterium]